MCMVEGGNSYTSIQAAHHSSGIKDIRTLTIVEVSKEKWRWKVDSISESPRVSILTDGGTPRIHNGQNLCKYQCTGHSSISFNLVQCEEYRPSHVVLTHPFAQWPFHVIEIILYGVIRALACERPISRVLEKNNLTRIFWFTPAVERTSQTWVWLPSPRSTPWVSDTQWTLGLPTTHYPRF